MEHLHTLPAGALQAVASGAKASGQDPSERGYNVAIKKNNNYYHELKLFKYAQTMS